MLTVKSTSLHNAKYTVLYMNGFQACFSEHCMSMQKL